MILVGFLLDTTNDWLQCYLSEIEIDISRFHTRMFYEEARIRDFDIVFVLGYTKIISAKVISECDHIFVIHESDLPSGRGFSPLQWQILQGKNRIKVCLLKVANGVDTGDIIEHTEIFLDGTELHADLREKQARATIELIGRFLAKFPEYQTYQQVGCPTYYRKREIADSELDVDKTIREQFNLLRICNNKDWPAFFEINGEKYVVQIEKFGH